MTSDLVNKYLYDVDGHVCAMQGLSNGVPSGTVTGYLYDAEGHRVAKETSPNLSCDTSQLQVTAEYFIGPDGETMTEVDPAPAGDMWVRTEVSAAGQYLATYTPDGVDYPITDWLGAERVQVNPNNTLTLNGVEETCTSYPFGDQLNCYTGIDASPRHFTGKERDTESGLDYFGARYYGSSMGRFMSPDWASHPQAVPYASLSNPQSLNLYAYVNNNPLSQVDADGHFASPWHFLLTFVAATATGHDPIHAAILGAKNVGVDFRKGSQSGDPSATTCPRNGCCCEVYSSGICGNGTDGLFRGSERRYRWCSTHNPTQLCVRPRLQRLGTAKRCLRRPRLLGNGQA